jgi:hypothetical protein
MEKNRSILSVNDLHVGVNRVSGTTPQTIIALRTDLLDAIDSLFKAHPDKDLYINGDALDGYDISFASLLAFLMICRERLRTTKGFLALARGNHDISKDSTRLSCFDFLCAVLKSEFGGRVKVFTEPGQLVPGHYVIPHLANQEIFNLAIEQAVANANDIVAHGGRPGFIHLHANYDNDFAIEQDHSLNVSEEQAQKLINAGYHLIFGHEHQPRKFPGVTIVGNQWPTSIADCLGNDEKHALIFHPTPIGWSMEEVTTWTADTGFIEVPWNELDVNKIGHRGASFVRVTGLAAPEEASKVLQIISKFRQVSEAYVVQAAVKYTGQEDVEELEVAAADMKALDVLEYLYEQLEPRQAEVVKRLLTGKEVANVSA